MADAGRVLLMPKGTYSSSTNYEVLDWVRYSNATYASKHNNNQGNTPTGNPTDPHWALLCQDGSGGGSNVSWTQLVTSGTKIATIEIDGVQTDVYAPSGGGGGTSDYADLTNKPQINGHTLSGNQTGADLGLANSSDIPTVDQTYSATSSNAQSGKAVASAISGKADTADVPTELNDLTDVTITSTPSQGETLIADANGVFKNQPMPQGGHTMLPTPSTSLTEAKVVKAINDATGANENVPSLFSIQQWTNEKRVRRVMTGTTSIGSASIGSTGIGAWTDKDVSQIVSADEADWWQDNAFIIPNNSDDIDLTLKFDPSSGEPVTLGGYILDTTTGKLCIKFGNSIATPANAKIAVDITYTRNEVS